MIIPLIPCPAPRMTKADKWKKRPCVLRYFQFRDDLKRLKVFEVPMDRKIVFIMPMPNSWPKKRTLMLDGQPHKQKPDLDNLLKSLLDGVYGDDSHIWRLSGLEKRWGKQGAIIFEEIK